MVKIQVEDTLILKGICKGNDTYLNKLMDKYIPYVSKIVFSLGGHFLSKEDVEEIISDTFYAIWQNRKKLRVNEDIKPYLAQIARNKTKNKLRGITNTSVQIIENLDDIIEESIFVDDLITSEQIKEIQTVVNSFSNPEKEILYGYYFYEFKLNDIANKLDLPISTVKSKLYRSREKLKQLLIEGGLYEKNIW